MGRPAKGGAARTKVVSVRLTPEEYAQVERAAGADVVDTVRGWVLDRARGNVTVKVRPAPRLARPTDVQPRFKSTIK